MAYRVELTARAGRNLKRIFRHINAESSLQASVWFNELEAAILSLDKHPERCPATPENPALRNLLFGKKPNVYRVVFSINARARVAWVLHIRHGGAPAIAETASGLTRRCA
jgi:plasmid stabilization system protein ParE